MRQRWAGGIALGLALCGAALPSDAADPLHFRHLTVDDGLSQSWAATILKDSRGFVWIGTQNGLNRYDGTGFRVYTHDPNDPTSLSAAGITRLLEDSKGRLWVVTEEGLDLYDRERDRFERVSLPDAPKGDAMRGLAEGRSGQLWIATENGLVEFDPGRRTSVRTLGDPSDPNRFSTNVLLDVLVDRDGILWVSAASGGVNRFDPRTRQVTRFPFPEATPGGTISAEVHGLYQDENGAIWVSVLGGGLGRIDPATRRVTRYLPDLDDPDSLTSDRVRCVLGDRRGHIYVGTENGGLDVLDVASGRFSHNRPDPDRPGSLNSGSIYSLLLDDQDILWVGTYDGGVNCALRAADRFKLVRTGPHGLSDPHVAAVLEDRQGDVWIGTDGGGLNRWQRKTGRFTVFRHDPRDRGSLPTDALLAILEDSRGELWVAGWAGGLSRFDRRSGRFTRFGAQPPGLFDHVFAMVEDGPDRIVLGTLGGPVVFDRRTRTFQALAGVPPAQPPLVQAVLRDTDGGLWLGHREGVDHLDRRTGRVTRYRVGSRDPLALGAGNCQALLQDSRGNVWIGTLRGLQVVPRDGAPLRRYTRADGLAGDAIKAILEDETGSLWVSTDRGLSRFAGGVGLPQRPQFSNFNKLDGLQGDEFRYGAAFRSRSGQMFFGGSGGLSVFSPREIQLNLVPPPVAITGLALSVRSGDGAGSDSLVSRSLAGVRELLLSHRQDFVTFEFAALNYILPAKNQYAYKMEGLDTGWRLPGNTHSATYTHLPPGSYVFRVRAANNDGVWNEEGVSLRIVVTPPVWARWWFRLTALVLLVAGLSAAYLVRVRSLRERERELAQRVEERTLELQLEIGERERAEAALRASEERYALAVRGTNDGIWDWDLTTNRVYYSPRWKAILGYGGAEIGDLPSEWFDRVHPEDLARLQAKLAAQRAGPLAHCEDEHRIRHKDGDFRRVLCRAFAVHDAGAVCVRVVGVITDVTDRRAFDPLTGLPTRGLFLQHLDEALVRGRQDAAVRVAVFVLDLDRFKMVNDSFGHLVGDKFLIEVANRISGCLRPSDLVARFAGDQFALMVMGVHTVGDAVRVMERIQNALKAPFSVAGTEVFASLSLGIALSTPDYERAEDLLRDGDTALHRAKASGTGRHEIFEPGMRLQVVERLRVESDLRRALERDELHLHYQPILSLASGRVEGFEGLVRWHHPERGLVMPRKFIRVAEETGLIGALGHTVMRQACRQLREWLVDSALPLPVWISVNVSAREFLDPAFVERVHALVEENQLPRSALRVEITETTLLEGDQFVRSRLERLRELGVGIDIDDFGTGYSSLSYLQQLPIDTLKIDQVFVSRLAGPAADPTIVRAILEMAKNLGLSAVAEGVETRQQLERLAHLGCPKVQGYYISAAVEPAAARALLGPRPGEGLHQV